MKSYILIGHYPAVDLVEVMLDKTIATPLFRIGWTMPLCNRLNASPKSLSEIPLTPPSPSRFCLFLNWTDGLPDISSSLSSPPSLVRCFAQYVQET